MRVGFGIAIAVLVLATGASAQRELDACLFDMQKLCADVEPGAGRMLQCLKENSAKVSPGCKAVLEKGRVGKKGGRIAACQGDIEKLCGSVSRGGGRISECLRSHAAELSEPCKEALSKRSAPAEATPAATVKAK